MARRVPCAQGSRDWDSAPVDWKLQFRGKRMKTFIAATIGLASQGAPRRRVIPNSAAFLGIHAGKPGMASGQFAAFHSTGSPRIRGGRRARRVPEPAIPE